MCSPVQQTADLFKVYPTFTYSSQERLQQPCDPKNVKKMDGWIDVIYS